MYNESYEGLLTYLLTPWSRVFLEKLTGFAANLEIPRFLWNPKVRYRTHKRPLIWRLATDKYIIALTQT